MTPFRPAPTTKTHPRLPSIPQRARSNDARRMPARMFAKSRAVVSGCVVHVGHYGAKGCATVNRLMGPIGFDVEPKGHRACSRRSIRLDQSSNPNCEHQRNSRNRGSGVSRRWVRSPSISAASAHGLAGSNPASNRRDLAGGGGATSPGATAVEDSRPYLDQACARRCSVGFADRGSIPRGSTNWDCERLTVGKDRRSNGRRTPIQSVPPSQSSGGKASKDPGNTSGRKYPDTRPARHPLDWASNGRHAPIQVDSPEPRQGEQRGRDAGKDRVATAARPDDVRRLGKAGWLAAQRRSLVVAGSVRSNNHEVTRFCWAHEALAECAQGFSCRAYAEVTSLSVSGPRAGAGPARCSTPHRRLGNGEKGAHGRLGLIRSFPAGMATGGDRASITDDTLSIQVCPPPSLPTPGDGAAGVLEAR